MTAQSGRLQSLALAVILAIGAGVIWLLLMVLGFTIAREALFGFAGSYFVGEHFIMDTGGTPYIESSHGPARPSYRTLDGKPLPSFVPKNEIYGGFFRGPILQGYVGSDWARRVTHLGVGSFHAPMAENWYFIAAGTKAAHGYFLGYSSGMNMRIGYVRHNGFTVNEPAAEEQFPVDSVNWPMDPAQKICFPLSPIYLVGENPGHEPADRSRLCYLIALDGLVRFDPTARAAKVVWPHAGIISVWQCGAILVRMKDQVIALDRDGVELGTYSLPPELREDDLTWYSLGKSWRTTGKDEVIVTGRWGTPDLFWLDAHGKILQHKRVDLKPPSHEEGPHGVAQNCLAMPSLAILLGIKAALPRSNPATYEQSQEYFREVCNAYRDAWPQLLTAGVVGIAAAISTYRRQRKYGLPWTWAWTGFVLLFGLPAYVGYLAHRSWPAAAVSELWATCAARSAGVFCLRPRVPPPPPKGIEVFA